MECILHSCRKSLFNSSFFIENVQHGNASRQVSRFSCLAANSVKGRTTTRSPGSKAAGTGFGSKPSGTGFGNKPPSAGTLLKRSEILYERLLEKHYQEGEVREFIICVRQKSGSHTMKMEDWVPVAELALVSEIEAENIIPKVIQHLCREIAECGAKGVSSIRQIPRSDLEYAYEPTQDFHDHVLDTCFKTEKQQLKPKSSDDCPYAILGLSKSATASEVRMAYRTLAAKHHPDKNPEVENDEQFKKIVNAFEKIKVNGYAYSGYAAIGGNDRQGFSQPITVETVLTQPVEDVQAAVRQIKPEIVAHFFSRSSRL